MTTEVVAVDPDRPDPATLDRAAAILRSGGLVAFGTETVYGLGADATNAEAVARIFAAKGRPATNPLIVHVADADQAHQVGDMVPRALQLADRFWPGPLTLILRRWPEIPPIVTANQGTVGVRVPASPVARELIRRAGVPIAAPSANRSNRISPTTAAHVLKDLDGLIELILDSGPCSVGIESTVLDTRGDFPTILRPGPITPEQVAEVLHQSVAFHSGSTAPDGALASPGLLDYHYAPTTPAFRLDQRAVLAFDPPPDRRWAALILGQKPAITAFEPPSRFQAASILKTPRGAAISLYNVLHRYDTLGLDFLVIVTPPDGEPGWEAVLDRVRRATRPWGEGSPRD